MQKIHPFLWFDTQAEEAMQFYCSVFKNAKPGKVVRNGNAGPGPKGSVLLCTFELEGLQFTALNAGPQFKFNEAISLVVDCKSQEEVDTLWEKLTAGGGKPGDCGWLKDKFGLSWQITPTVLIEAISDPDPGKSSRAMRAMMQMTKIDIAKIQAAARG
jgi:predicted 3-demethylubiquinone-9 3-methyltransferase (glyoxalase superfamily)